MDVLNSLPTQSTVNKVVFNEETTETPLTDTVSSDPSTGEEFTTFITLLTTQIRNQDPTSPLESTQFVEQLATFSSLELQAKSNDILSNIAEMLTQLLAENSGETGETGGDVTDVPVDSTTAVTA